MSFLRIRLASVLEWSDFRRKDEIVAAWSSMEALVKDYSYTWNNPFMGQAPSELSVSIDTSCVRDFLTSLHEDQDDGKRFLGTLERHWNGETVLYLDMSFSHAKDVRRPDIGLGLFLQELFLSLNIAVPGSCCFFGASVDRSDAEIDSVPTPGGGVFHSAHLLCNERGWPNLGSVTPIQAWEWLKAIDFGACYIAESSTQRAVMTLLEIASGNKGPTSSDVVGLVQALEAVYIGERNGICSLFRDRIHSVLGIPPTHKKWATQIYDLRSRIAHGGFPAIWPDFSDDFCSRYNEIKAELMDAEDQAFLVLLATIRDLIRTRSISYSFDLSVNRHAAKQEGC